MFKKLGLAIFLVIAFSVTTIAAWNGIPLKNPKQLNPSLVNIQITKNNGDVGICTGSLFHTQVVNGKEVGFILTAGHCVPGATEFDVVFFSNDRSGFTVVSSKSWVRHEKLLDAESDGQVFMGPTNGHEIHDVAVIMIDRIPPTAKSLPILPSYTPKTGDLLYILARTEEDKFKTISSFVTVPITNLQHLTLNGSTDVKDANTSLLFEAAVVQPGEDRGICPGDSGGAIVTYKDGQPYTVGILSAMYDPFPVSHSQVCGRSVMYYGISFNSSWLEKAVQHLINKTL